MCRGGDNHGHVPSGCGPFFFCQTPVPPHESHGPSKMTPILIISFIPAPRLQSATCSQNFPAVAAAAMGLWWEKRGTFPMDAVRLCFFAWTLWPHTDPRDWVNSPPFLILHLCSSPCHVNFPPCPQTIPARAPRRHVSVKEKRGHLPYDCGPGCWLVNPDLPLSLFSPSHLSLPWA